MEDLQDILELNLQPHDLDDLRPKVRQIYSRRMELQLMTVKSIEDFVDIIFHAEIEQRELKDLQPDVRAVYEKRVAYHNLISRLLKNDMIEVAVKPVKEAPTNEEDKEAD